MYVDLNDGSASLNETGRLLNKIKILSVNAAWYLPNKHNQIYHGNVSGQVLGTVDFRSSDFRSVVYMTSN